MARVSWPPILAAAKAIVESYDTSVTLRQAFYRLVSRLLIPNLQSYYRRLSQHTAAARRDGVFPDLVDERSEIEGGGGDTSPRAALRSAALYYSRDHSEGQPYLIYLGVEKRGMRSQLSSWFGDLDVRRVALGGYASQSYCDEIRRDVERDGRAAVLIIATDHDPTGWDLYRDFIERTNCWAKVIRIALDPSQIEEYDLPESVEPEVMDKLERDPRARRFVDRFESLTQVELDALPPDVLRQLYQDAIDEFWDPDAYEAVLAREADERARLIRFANEWEDDE